ncbi:MAG: hypothetical protein KF832_17680 [Caldilineaceae bacterium]|nr:hypothetical protein [Caldilineaceae bacterium]
MNLATITPVTFAHWRRPALPVGLIGLLVALYGLWASPTQFWQAYLLAYLFWLALALGSLGFVLLHHLMGGRWSALILRLMETGAMTLPLLALASLPFLVGVYTLYPWADPAYVAASELVQRKTDWLNVPFFLGRGAFYLLIWSGLAYSLRRFSLAQDRTGAPPMTRQLRRLSALGMILYLLTATFAGYDWMMSLEPEWFSSIYGLLFIAGQALAALALAILGLRHLAKSLAAESQWLSAWNDLGNILLGFVMIWAYFAYSQFLVIWSADLPEEAIWYYHRIQGGWQTVAWVLIGLQFVFPFLLLLSRAIKRSLWWLTLLAGVILLGRLVDLYWLIMPAFYPTGFQLHWLTPVLWLALGGWWLLAFSWLWPSHAPLPRHDPRLAAEEMHPADGVPAEQTTQLPV